MRLRVSIADVSHYVTPLSAVDAEGYARGTSVYFPDRCIPMLPEELSNGICSLNPDVDRLTMTAEILFDQARSPCRRRTSIPASSGAAARLTYTTVKKILVDKDAELLATYSRIVADLQLMEQLATVLTEKGRERGSIDFDLPEPEIILDLQGQTEAIIRAERNIAHRIIEEFMLAANEAVALHLENNGIPSLYRVHETPDVGKARTISASSSGASATTSRLTEDQCRSRGSSRSFLPDAEGKPEEKLINGMLLRCMKQARYSAPKISVISALPHHAIPTSLLRSAAIRTSWSTGFLRECLPGRLPQKEHRASRAKLFRR